MKETQILETKRELLLENLDNFGIVLNSHFFKKNKLKDKAISLFEKKLPGITLQLILSRDLLGMKVFDSALDFFLVNLPKGVAIKK